MQATVNTPWGKLRSQSQRRYLVVYEGGDGRPHIEYRSDNFGRALAKRRYGQVVIDTVENRVVAS